MTAHLKMALPHAVTDPLSLARGLGWFSLGLGAAEVLAGGSLSRGVGAGGWAALTRLCGVREIGVGAGLLTMRWLAPWMWGRVAGDALDLAGLGYVLAASTDKRARAGAALALVAGITALDVACAVCLSHRRA
jgi:hypothetical protein